LAGPLQPHSSYSSVVSSSLNTTYGYGSSQPSKTDCESLEPGSKTNITRKKKADEYRMKYRNRMRVPDNLLRFVR